MPEDTEASPDAEPLPGSTPFHNARIALHALCPDDTGLPASGVVPAGEYSRFKHGDAAAARVFGSALAHRFAQVVDLSAVPTGTVCGVTSSGYGQVPPAAAALVTPFLKTLRVYAPHLDLRPFRVHRLGVSPGDYAQMSSTERTAAVDRKAMHVDPRVDLSGHQVIALDDIRVTGTHEVAMDHCLNDAGASWIDHVYLVDAFACAGDPTLESRLNETAVRSIEDVLSIVRSPGFIPNARVCKHLVLRSAQEQRWCVQVAPRPFLLWMASAIERDQLTSIPAYRVGAVRFLSLLAEADHLSGVTA